MPGQRVLVVDDNQGFRDQVVGAIAATGQQVHGIARGSEALRLCASFQPDLLIVDLVRQTSEGRWLIERLLRRGDETPLGPPPQAVLGLVPIGGDFSDLPDGVDLQVKPMFASQVVSLAQRLLVQLPGPVSRPPFDPATTAPISATGPTAPMVPTLQTAASGRPPASTRPTPAPSPTLPRSSRAQADEVPIAVEHVAPPRGYRSRDRFEEESSDFDPGQTLLAPVSMQELARSMNRSADEMMAITVASRPSDPGQSGEEIEIIESDGGDGGDAETADTHPRFDVELRLNPMGTAPSARPVPPPLQDPSGSVPASLLADPSGALRLSQSEPPSTLSGDLAGIALLDIVALLARQGQTGLLRVTSASKQQQIDCVLRKGRLEQATATGFPALQLGRFVLELDTLRQPEIDAVAARGAAGQTGPHQRSDQDATQVLDIGPGGLLGERASSAPRSQELLGVRLMAAGLLKREELQQALSRQSAELLFEALRMGRGRFRFLRTTELPQLAVDPQLGGGLGLDIEALLLEAVRRQDAWQQVDRDATEGAVYVSQVKTAEELRQIGLAPAESAVLLLCTGRTGLADIARESRLPLAEVQKALQRLQSLGLVRRRLPAVLAS